MKLIIPDTNSKEFRALLTSGDGEDEGVRSLRGYVTPERMTQVALLAIRKAPGLLRCRVESLLAALTLCMEAGLEPDGRNAHLVACGDEVRVVFDWKGLVALGRRCGVGAIHADVVCEGDDFGVSYDGGARLTHKIDYKSARGEVYAVYCYSIVEGEPDVEVMTREEVERVREEERATITPEPANSAHARLWEEDWCAMAKQVAVCRASLKWPLDAGALAAFRANGAGADDDAAIFGGGVAEGGAGGGATPPVAAEPALPGKEDDQSPPFPEATPLEALRHFMHARRISEAAMLDYLKEEGRIADFVGELGDVPAPVIEQVVESWVDMMEEGEF